MKKEYETLHTFKPFLPSYHGIGVGQEVLQQLQKSLVFDQLRVNVMQFGHANGGSFADVWVLVLNINEC